MANVMTMCSADGGPRSAPSVALASGTRAKHQLPLRPAFVPMHGKKSTAKKALELTTKSAVAAPLPSLSRQGTAATIRSTTSSRYIETAPELTWQQRELLSSSSSSAEECQQRSLARRGASGASAAATDLAGRLTWQQEELLKRRQDQPVSSTTETLAPIVISLQSLAPLGSERAALVPPPPPPPLRFEMTSCGPKVSFYSGSSDARPASASRTPVARVTASRRRSPSPSPARREEVASDLPHWYDPLKDGPIQVVSGCEARRYSEREGLAIVPSSFPDAAARQVCASPPSPYGPDHQWFYPGPPSPALSCSTSLPDLDASSSSSSSSSGSSIRSDSPDMGCEPFRTKEVYGRHRLPSSSIALSGASNLISTAEDYRLAIHPLSSTVASKQPKEIDASNPPPYLPFTHAGDSVRALARQQHVYAGPNFCTTAPPPHLLPIPAFARSEVAGGTGGDGGLRR